MIAPAGQTTARAGLRSKLAALVVRRQAPPNPRRGEQQRCRGGIYAARNLPRQPVNGKGGGLPPSLAPLVRKFSQQSVGAGHARPAALLCHPFAFCIVGRGLDPSAASRRREPQKPLRPSLPLGLRGFAAQSTPNSTPLPFPKLYKLYTLYTKPAPSLQNLYRDCTVLWSKPAQNRGTISLLPVKHWQNIQTIPHKFGKKGEYTHETYFCNCCRYRCCAGSEPGCLRLCRFRRCFLCPCREHRRFHRGCPCR